MAAVIPAEPDRSVQGVSYCGSRALAGFRIQIRRSHRQRDWSLRGDTEGSFGGLQ